MAGLIFHNRKQFKKILNIVQRENANAVLALMHCPIRCVEFLKEFKGKLITTEPVLTEAVYLLGPSVKAQKACIEFILRGGAALVPQSPESLSRAAMLMEKYKDIPMDFADATLVTLAEETSIYEVFTLDVKGFNSYRIHGRKTFSILP